MNWKNTGMRETMKTKTYKWLRMSFAAALAAAALFVSGGKHPSLEKTAEEKNRIQAAEQLVCGSVSDAAQWKTCASINPMFFIEIEAGNL